MLSRRSLLASGAAATVLGACVGVETNTQVSPNALPLKIDPSAPPSTRLADFFETLHQQGLTNSPERATSQGDKRNYDKWDDDSDIAVRREVLSAQVNAVTAQRMASLAPINASDALSVRLFIKNAERAKSNAPFIGHAYLFNQMFGEHAAIPTFLANQHKVTSIEDAQAYIARLEGIPQKLGHLIDRSRASAAQGITPPQFVYDLVLRDCTNLLKGAPFGEDQGDSPMWSDVQSKFASLSVEAATKTRLAAQARSVLIAKVKPAYENLMAVLTAQKANARTTDGVWALPDGEAYYAERLAFHTTTNLTADEIHQIGLDNVGRLHAEMAEVMGKIGFSGTRDAFFEKLETDPQFYIADTPEGKAGYIRQATALIDTMRAKIPTAFNLIPRAPMVVRAVEPFREASAGLAFYQRATPDGSRPGIFYVNTFNVKAIPTYQMEALAYHEGIPGHHMQRSIEQELQGIPEFSFTAYSEGWGLYTELLGKEMGFYTDPYSDFGRLTLELRRAIRLVVDTGLHAKRWPRQQAIDYVLTNQPGDLASTRRDIDRYIVNPGQATAYLIGQIEILRLREGARRRLGAAFTLAKFHDVVLGNGSVPLDVLGELVGAMV